MAIMLHRIILAIGLLAAAAAMAARPLADRLHEAAIAASNHEHLTDEAIRAYALAIRLAPASMAGARHNLRVHVRRAAAALQRSGRLAEAAAMCRRVALNGAVDAAGLRDLAERAVVFFHTANDPTAVADAYADARFRRVLDASASHNVHFALATALVRTHRPEEAIRAYSRAIAAAPTGHRMRDTAAFLLSAVTRDRTVRRAPDAHVRALFDSYADDFDAHLVGRLRYRSPEIAAAALGRVLTSRGGASGRRSGDDGMPPKGRWTVVDAGCGTGLSGQAFHEYAADGGTLVGIDLSSEMLKKAEALAIYDRLVEGSLTNVLPTMPGMSAHVVVSLNVFVYFGDLSDLFREAARVLKADGWFVFDFELMLPSPDKNSSDGASWELGRAGRYRHSEAFVVANAAEHGLVVEERESFGGILEGKRPVSTMMVVCTKTTPHR